MKSFILPVLMLSALSLAACESSQVAQSDSRRIELVGTQARQTIEVPVNSTTAEPPYALQGHAVAHATVLPGETGYQAR